MISSKRRRQVRRKIGGDIWNSNIETIRKAAKNATGAIKKINAIINEVSNLLSRMKNSPFVEVFIFHLTNASVNLTTVQNALTEIVQAIEEIDEISQQMVTEEQERLTLVKPERKTG